MKFVLLICIMVNNSLHTVETSDAMTRPECEEIKDHPAIVTSYPGMIRVCMEAPK
jgi:hypothetical protein